MPVSASRVVAITAGRPRSSARRPAIRPMIPTCHSPRISNAVGSEGPSIAAATDSSTPGSTSKPRMARASPMASFVTARRSRLAVSISAASSAASAGSLASRSLAARAASPILPAAFSRGAIAKPMSSRSRRSRATPARSSNADKPGRAPDLNCSRPSCAIGRFSPRIGATSATVPMRARSASARTAGGNEPAAVPAAPVPASVPAPPAEPSSPIRRCANFQATPAPVSLRSG